MNKYIKISIILISLLLVLLCFNIQNTKEILSYIRIKIAQSTTNVCKLTPENNTVNIVAITDSDFITPLNVTIYSAIKNKNKESKYHFYIIGVGLNNYDTRSLKKQSTDDAKITIIPNKNIYNFYNPNNFMNPHVPNCDFFKFNLPNIFPKFDKILYLDGDLLIQKDLSTLYNTNIDNSYIGCVQENYFDFPLEEELNIPKYFNNGVMLLNLKKMRKDNITDKMLRYRIFNAPMRFATQDTFNVVLQPALKFLDEKYNIIVLDIYKKNVPNAEKYLREGVIIHFAGKDKPWNNPEFLYSSEWQKYHDEFQKKYDDDME